MSNSISTNILDSFIFALNEKNIQPTAEELADALWLSIKTSHCKPLTKAQHTSIRKSDEDITIEDNNSFFQEKPVRDTQACDQKNNDYQRDDNEDDILVYAKTNINDSSSCYQTIRMPSTVLLPDKLYIERSLRSLMLKVPSRNRLILNEEETVKRIVEEKIWLPVFQGVPERDYDIAVIIDVSESMILWQSILHEFRMLLEHQGAFRDVRVWKLNGDTTTVHLYIDSTDNNESRVCSPLEIIDTTRNRIVLVISDCIAKFWYSNDMIKMIKLWGQKHPVTILQMLPHRLWPSTALSKGHRVKLRSNAMIKSNHQLMIHDPFIEKKYTNDILKIPVITLEHHLIAQWAKTITGHSDTWLSGYVFELNNDNNSQQGKFSEVNKQTPDKLSAKDRIRNFFLFASPPAQKLARYLSSAPLTLPIMRLVQQVMLPESKIIHLAEFFLSGLIKRIPMDTTNTLAVKYEYDFYEGVRDILFDTIIIPEAINVTEKVSLYLENHYGYSSDFQALLLKPDKADIKPDKDLHFASIKAKVLKKIGGEYTQLAEDYIQVSKNFIHESTKFKKTFNNSTSDIDYKNSNKTGDNDYLYEAKLIIIGEAGAGKTTFAKKIMNHDYQFSERNPLTEGIDVFKWKFDLDNGHPFCVNIWDFGGQEIYHSIHQLFMTKRSLYTLVVDSRKENTDIDYWLNIVSLLSDNSPLLIIINEKHGRKTDIEERRLCNQFGNIKGILSTDIASNTGLESIVKAIKYHLSSLPHVGSALPKTWIDVRRDIERDHRNYISIDEYLNICDEHGLNENRDKLHLSNYLHDLGVCLHFQDDSILKQLVILKPQWCADAIYEVLDHRHVQLNRGRLGTKDLADIWHEKKYQGMEYELLQLMIKFQLCYEIPGRKGNYIVPQLLKSTIPAYNWEPSDNIHLRYKYEFMPQGIITRFIVTMYRWIHSQEYVWRSGVILSTENTKAEIIEHFSTREITIRVSGYDKKKLMSIVMNELDKIHDSFHGLKYDKLVPCNCSQCTGNPYPNFYKYINLIKRKENQRSEIECDYSLEMVNVSSLLDGIPQPQSVDPDFPHKIQEPVGRKKIYISYSHKDSDWKNRLKAYLNTFNKQDVDIWDDSQISTGDHWKQKIFNAINRSNIAILLISSNFLASTFISEIEVPALLKKQKEGLTILPILISDCPWREFKWLSKIQIFPYGAKPLSSFEDIDRILTEILSSILDGILQPKSSNNIFFDSIIPLLCNREKQVYGFESNFLKIMEKDSLKKIPQFYIIHGSEDQGHLSLIQRLEHTVIRTFLNKHKNERIPPCHAKVLWPDKENSFLDKKNKLLSNLFSSVIPNYDNERIKTIETLNKLEVLKKYRNNIVIISHNIYAKLWDKNLIDWYMESFWKKDSFTSEEGPHYIVFFNVLYPKIIKKGFLGIKSDNSIIKHIKKDISKICLLKKCMLIDELNQISKQHVRDWFFQYKSNIDIAEVENIINQMFKKANFLSMNRVEEELKRLGNI